MFRSAFVLLWKRRRSSFDLAQDDTSSFKRNARREPSMGKTHVSEAGHGHPKCGLSIDEPVKSATNGSMLLRQQAPTPYGQYLGVGEFFGALGGAHNGFDEGDAQTAFFEFKDAVDGAASRGGDGVFQQRWMVAGLEHHLG